MYSENFMIYAVAVLSFFLSFGGFYYLSLRNEELEPSKNTPFLIMLPVLAAAFLFLFSQLSDQRDFIFSLKLEQLLFPLGASAVIYFGSRFQASPYMRTVVIMFCSAAAFFLQPEGFELAPGLNSLCSGLILSLILFLFSVFYPYINKIDGISGIQSAGIGMGIFTLSLIGGVPALLGAFGLSLAAVVGAFLIFNWYPAKLSLTSAGSSALGVLLGWLMLIGTYEGSGPAIIIFALFFIVEILAALLKFITLRPEYRNLAANTYCYQANLSGFPPYSIAANVFRLQLILLIMGSFELYAPNAYTIPLFTLVVTAWYLSKIKNWQTANKTIREVNRDLMTEIKNNINTIKDQINKEK